MELQATLALVQGGFANRRSPPPVAEDVFGRKPFAHEALKGLENLAVVKKQHRTGKLPLASVAERYGTLEVIRWTPRKVAPSACRLSCGFNC